MAFHELPWAQRFGKMGDEAEGKYLELVNPKAHRFGLNRPNLHVPSMPVVLRSAPDLCEQDHFVEVIGIGRDRTAKVRLEKTDSLRLWAVIAPVRIFIWSSYDKAWWLCEHHEFDDACRKYGELRYFEDSGRPYWAIHCDKFPAEKHKAP